MSIMWLASYPKSGNTWLRFFLYNYFYGEVRKTDEILSKIPDLHKDPPGLDVSTGRVFCKTHYLFSSQHPLIDDTSGFIYLLRHPRDVLLSNLNYFRLIGDCRRDQDIVVEFIENSGIKRWIDAGIGSWPQHVESWLSKQQLPHLILRYEDMLLEPLHVFEQVLVFLDTDIDRKRFNRAVYLSSFKKMKALEEMEIKKGRSGGVFANRYQIKQGDHGVRFMNRGGSGQSLERFGQGVEEYFNTQFGDVLKDWGYE